MPKKIRDIKAILKEAGFVSRPGKGSHSNWKHPQLPQVITVARKDGADALLYPERKVLKALKQLEALSDDSD
ncbi:MAG: type II toxin-antitoxin system HicA family toxin [Acaryochloris sp. CRU_2_0]|nr:type II toxin-antitoxin system HicA family toxin [Acaryochloris sp. CRU_2_0]